MNIFNVGDRVRNIIHYSDTHWPKDYEFVIEVIDSSGTLMGKCKNGQKGGLRPDSVVLVSAANQTASSFKIGDRVKVITPNYVGYGKEATITKIQANAFANTFIELLLDGSLAPIYGYEDKNLELLPPPLVYTPNPFTHLIPITGQPSQYRRVGDTVSVTIGDYEPSNSHTHNWKFYQGLNSRFEFCTVCDQKRDTDKRA